MAERREIKTCLGIEEHRRKQRRQKGKIVEIDIQLEWAVEIVLNLFLSNISVVSYVSVSISPRSSLALASFVL